MPPTPNEAGITIRIDPSACSGCGVCARLCPSRALAVVDGKAVLTGAPSIECGHCEAACPSGAIRVPSLDNDSLRLESFRSLDQWLPYGEFDVSILVQLMRSRRSCRRYGPKPVPIPVLRDLVRIGMTAPSGTNSQLWQFTLLPHREAVLSLAVQIGMFFQTLNNKAEKKWLRLAMKWLGRPQLDAYYRQHYPSVSQALHEWQTTGNDRLFHGAPSAIIIGSRPGASCPAEDALLAAQNILLGSHAMGLGSCLIGFAVVAMQHAPEIRESLGIRSNESIHAVIALGYPDVTFHRLIGRKPAFMRIADISDNRSSS